VEPALRTSDLPSEFTKTVRNDPLVEQFLQRLPGQFPCFRSNSYPSVQNWSTLQLNYHLRMLDVARAGDVIVIWRLDRLGRSLKQLIETVTMLAERGIELRSLKENIDTTTPTGKLLFHIIGAMAEFERDVISERTQAGLEAARARGRRGGRPKAIEKIELRNLARAKELYTAKQNTIQEIMQMTGFKSRNTFYKYVVNAERQ
jgi:DNA invertase Pin-like site-specific DNA recombinase